MPYLIDPRRHTDDEIQWEDVWPDEKVDTEYVRLGGNHGQEPVLKGPIPYRIYKGSQGRNGILPDILPGRWACDMIVSQRLRKMIEDMDTVAHYFIPLDLTLKDGSIVHDRFLFVAGDLVDGIVAEESQVTPKIFNGKLGHYSVPGSPRIVWRADAVKDRAIWVDRYLRRQFAISDELESAFERAGFKYYRKTHSPIQFNLGGD